MNVKARILKALSVWTVERIKTHVVRCQRCGHKPEVVTGTTLIANTDTPIATYSIHCCGTRMIYVGRSHAVLNWNLIQLSIKEHK